MAATPTPWHMDAHAYLAIRGADDFLVAACGNNTDNRDPDGIDKLQKANTALIVRAVNAHEDLVAALKSILEWYDGDPEKLSAWSECMITAHGLVAKAQP